MVGKQIEFDQRLWHEPDEKWYGWRWKYQGQLVMCQESSSYCKQLTNYSVGDEIQVGGVVEELKVGGEVVGKTIQVKSLEVKTNRGLWVSFLSNWLAALTGLRQKIVDLYQGYLPSPMAELMAGIVLGEKAELGDDFYESLITTGTVHVVAASGYNITVVAGAMMAGLVLFVSRKRAAVLAQAGIWSYVMLAGMSPPVIRAGIMGSLVFGAQALGREAEAKWGLVLSIFVMLLNSPWMIVDVSFQLSVAATAGILWGMKPITQVMEMIAHRLVQVIGNNKIQDPRNKQDTNHKLQRSSNKEEKNTNDQTIELVTASLRGNLSTTLAATLATLPIIMVVFERVSIISPLVNVMVLWTVPPIMVLGAGSGLLGLFWAPVGQLVAYLSYPLLWWFVAVVEGMAQLPFASVETEGNWMMAVGWWMILGVWWRSRR